MSAIATPSKIRSTAELEDQPAISVVYPYIGVSRVREIENGLKIFFDQNVNRFVEKKLEYHNLLI